MAERATVGPQVSYLSPRLILGKVVVVEIIHVGQRIKRPQPAKV
jgi:hypothetical protein